LKSIDFNRGHFNLDFNRGFIETSIEISAAPLDRNIDWNIDWSIVRNIVRTTLGNIAWNYDWNSDSRSRAESSGRGAVTNLLPFSLEGAPPSSPLGPTTPPSSAELVPMPVRRKRWWSTAIGACARVTAVAHHQPTPYHAPHWAEQTGHLDHRAHGQRATMGVEGAEGAEGGKGRKLPGSPC